MRRAGRLRFFATLFSVYTLRKSDVTHVRQWLARARDLQPESSVWSALTAELSASVESMVESETRKLIEEQTEKLVAQDVDIVTQLDSHYPSTLRRHLGDRAPLFLWFRGNPNLFEKLSVGFCGSRRASELGLEVCSDIVAQLVEHKVVVVAGYAAGVDQIAHLTALRTGGETVAVLAEGILNFSVRQILATEWKWDRSLVVSEFLPQKRWSVAQAMQRNRTIVGLGQALVVIEARESGGTFEAGKEALSLGHPLFAPIYGSLENNVEGNKLLITRGATPLMKSRSSGRANVDSLLKILEGPTQELTDDARLARKLGN